MHPSIYNAQSGATSIRRIPFASPQPFRLVGGGQRVHSRERTGRLRHARYVQRKGNSGSPKGGEPYGDGVLVVVVGVTPHQGERESRLQGQVAQVFAIIRNGEVCVMQRAETLLEIIHERGKRGLPLERLYRHLFNPELYLRAYGKIYRNDGSMTPGVNAETVDGMSLKKIQVIIDALRYERYRWTPVRRVYIDKKGSPGKRRPLGLPTWSDKLLQEVIRSLLEAYYEPQFSEHSHGFRPGKGCHTALAEVSESWRGTTWFIEGDISQCLDAWSHCSFR